MKTPWNILYQSSNTYVIPTGVSIASLCENNKDIDSIHFYLLADNIDDENLSVIKSICDKYKREITIIDPNPFKEIIVELGLPTFNGSYTPYYKLFAFDRIPFPGNQVLYLDGDTIIEKSLRGLFDADESDTPLISAVIDLYLESYKSLIGLSSKDYYINTGVMLIDAKQWVENKCLSDIIHHLKNGRSSYAVADQDIISVILGKKVKAISPKYNYNPSFDLFGTREAMRLYETNPESYYSLSEIEKVREEGPVIYHLLGGMTGRPWEKGNSHPQKELFNRYLSLTNWTQEDMLAPSSRPMFRAQWMAYKYLPRPLYLALHKAMLNRYLIHREKSLKN